MQDKYNTVSERPMRQIIGQCPVCHSIIVTTTSMIFFNQICEDCEQAGWRYDLEGRVMRIENGKVTEILMN